MVIKIQIALVIIILVTGCASKPEQTLPCKGRECKTTDLLDNTASKEEWYCYGKKNGGDWYCGNQADDTRIVAITARSIVDVEQMDVKQIDVQQAQVKQVDEENLVLDVAPIPEPIPKLTIKETNNPLPASATSQSSVLDGYSRDAYTLQVIATSDEEKLRQYIERNEIKDHIVARTLSQGSQWYVLLIGIYSGYTEAKNAQLEWTNNRPSHSAPWVRDIGSIQDVLITQEEE